MALFRDSLSLSASLEAGGVVRVVGPQARKIIALIALIRQHTLELLVLYLRIRTLKQTNFSLESRHLVPRIRYGTMHPDFTGQEHRWYISGGTTWF